ncbi:hypothetical protein AUL39_03395 [Tractidigestivibacter scatoligenes]|jgi:DNA-binding MarR family transcriptional regulator|uniref:HTH marR-type domain-containing protein n=1 Tax=Tractidigestivibacter scatoligenes TaxID=1299998 RepID=A0A100YX87_TRASO|nr:MarR family winged helix-turn-helix transcriptional regulator [Tractidigestivibacter scatoligenes]KUH59375.1 hypothetical protein AUL39_03395 [Tractidigestivibacter scatoligenes]
MADDFHLIRKIARISSITNNMCIVRLHKLELTPAQSEAVLFVHEHPEESISSLKNCLGISHQAAQALVSRMKRKGIIQTEISPIDSRQVTMRLTQLGNQTYTAILKDGADALSAITVGMTEEEKAALETLLDRLLSNLDSARY